MTLSTVADLERLIVRSGLVYAEEFAACLRDVGASAKPEMVLAALERRQLLTPFQTQRIRKGETEGLIVGGCKLLYKNASGSFARLYRGMRISDGRMIGVKVLRERWANDPDMVKLFHREGDLGKRLKHPNIVPIYDTGTEGKFHYITMEFVEGGNLRDFLKIRGRLEPLEACRYGLDMARALDYAVQQGITHRDLKLTNVLMSSTGVAKLIDFGLAAEDPLLRRADGPDLAVALEYSTLERNSGAPANDPRSDLFFLGTILFELISGTEPYPRTRDREERKSFARYRDIPPLSSRVPNLPFPVAQLIDRLLQVNPNLRHQSAGEVAAELENVLRELGHPPASVRSSGGEGTASQTPMVLCVEHRPKMQDILRDYLAKHGYRALLLSDPDRALSRLKSNPPAAILFFQDASGDRVMDDYREALKLGKCPALLVVNKSQLSQVEELNALPGRGTVLAHPLQLRDLRMALQELVPVNSPAGS
jgi:serine/threonine protein kinase